MTIELILVGFGNVARRFTSLLEERRSQLAADHDLTPRIVGIATRRGRAYAARGLDAAAFGATLRGDDRGASALRHADSRGSTLEFLGDALDRSAEAARDGRLVVVETTTLDIDAGEPAISHVTTALAAGAHVVTANKGPAAFAYQTLSRLADQIGRASCR